MSLKPDQKQYHPKKELKICRICHLSKSQLNDNGICGSCISRIEKNAQKQNKPIKKESDKMKALKKEYLKLREQFLKDNPKCAVTGKKATEVHHMKGRTGKDLLDVSNFLPVSREAHIKIELNVSWAKEKGYSKDRTNA